MAKKKESATESVGLALLTKKYGNVIRTGAEIFDRNKNLVSIPVSTSFDNALNGGILEGTWTVLSGPPKGGKSTWCLQVIANAQKIGKKAFYVDAECRLKNYNLSGIKDLDQNMLQVIGPDDDQEMLAAEDVFTIIESIVKDPANKGCVLVLDSISSLLPRSEMDAEISGTLRANLPKTITHWGKKIAQKITSNKIALIIITHYITNTSGYGKKNVADSGTYIQYQASNRIDFLKTEDWLENETKVGIKITAEIDCSGNGAVGGVITSYIRFGTGIDSVKEILELGEAYGIIIKAGAWFSAPTLPDLSETKFQGATKLYEHFATTPTSLSALQAEIKAMLS
jgi:recombination protein RecA